MVNVSNHRRCVLVSILVLAILKGSCQEDTLRVDLGTEVDKFSKSDTGNYLPGNRNMRGYSREKQAEKIIFINGEGQRKFNEFLVDPITDPDSNRLNPRWYIGLGLGYTVFFYSYEKNGPFPPGGKTGGLQSLHLELLYAFNDRWMLESGVALKAIVPPEYISTIGGKPEAGMIIIPLRLNYSIDLVPRELDLMIFAGYSQGIKSEQFSFGFLSPDISADGDYYGNVLFPFADIGARLKIVLGRIHLGAFVSYSQGFRDIYRIQVADMPNVSGGYPRLIVSNGSHLNFGLNAYYAVFGKKHKK